MSKREQQLREYRARLNEEVVMMIDRFQKAGSLFDQRSFYKERIDVVNKRILLLSQEIDKEMVARGAVSASLRRQRTDRPIGLTMIPV